MKGPIATLDLAVESVPPRLKVFETLHDKHDTRPMLVHAGVSVLLLDYLLVTALLLVTDVQEWMLVEKYEGQDSIFPSPATAYGSDNGSPRSPVGTSTSASQWRKIVYGEPLFPKRAPNPMQSTSELVPNPTSPEQMAKIIYGEPIYPTLRTPSPALSGTDSDEDDEADDETHYDM